MKEYTNELEFNSSSEIKNKDIQVIEKEEVQIKKGSDNINLQEEEKELNKKLILFNIAIIVIILILIVLTFIYFDTLKIEFLRFVEYFKSNILIGTLILIIIKVIGTILYIPGVLLAIGVGYAYHQVYEKYYISIPISTLVYFIGSCIGCTIAFSIGRYVLGSLLRPKLIKLKYFRVLDKAILKNGKKINFLLRSSPAIPYNIMNYFLGITKTTYLNYIFGLLGFIPLLILYSFIGCTLKDLNNLKSDDETLQIIILVSSIVLSIICIIIITRLAKKELDLELHNLKNKEIEDIEAKL